MAKREVYVCFERPLGKIWKGDYVEIFSQLPLECFNLNRPHREEKKDERHRYLLIPRTFTNWLQVFAILTSVIGEKAPENCSAFMCYLDAIGEVYRVYSGQAWLRYDKQFRQCSGIRLVIRTSDSG